ncbi:hypothetical protein niasHT_024619 [Heterodera trifolii]|uniref:Uncharacterized protein n=1 Tax=Heterodera trifolii TaxID=157864 RepID=A0ABD2K7I5_9BILA
MPLVLLAINIVIISAWQFESGIMKRDGGGISSRHGSITFSNLSSTALDTTTNNHDTARRRRWRRGGNGEPSLGRSKSVRQLSRAPSHRRLQEKLVETKSVESISTKIRKSLKNTFSQNERQTYEQAEAEIKEKQVSLAIDILSTEKPETVKKLKEVLKLAIYNEQTLTLFKSEQDEAEKIYAKAYQQYHYVNGSNDNKKAKEKWERKREEFRKIKRKIKTDIFDKTEKGDDFSFGNHIINAVERKNEIVAKLLYDWEKKKLYEWDRNQMSIWVAKQYKNPDPPGQRHKLYAHGLTNSDNHERIQLIIHVLLVDAVFDRLARDLCRKAAFEVQFRNWAAVAKQMEDEEIRNYVCTPLNKDFHGLTFEFDPQMHSTFDEDRDDWEELDKKPRKNFIKELVNDFRNPKRDAKSRQAKMEAETEENKWEMLNARSREERKKAMDCVKGSELIKSFQDKIFSDEATSKQLGTRKNIAELKGDVKKTKKLQKQNSGPRRTRRANEDDPINQLKRNLSRQREFSYGPPPPSQSSSSSSSPSSSLSSPSSSSSSFSASHRLRPPMPHRRKSSPPAQVKGVDLSSSSPVAGTSSGPFDVAESVHGLPILDKSYNFLRSNSVKEAEEKRRQQRQHYEALVRRNGSTISANCMGGNGLDDDEEKLENDEHYLEMDSPRNVQQQTYHDGGHRRLDKNESKKLLADKKQQLAEAEAEFEMQLSGLKQTRHEHYERMRRSSVSDFSDFYDEFVKDMRMSNNKFLAEGLNQMVDDAKLMGNINSGEDPHYDQLTESEKEKIELKAGLEMRTRLLFAAGPGRVFLRAISVLSKQMTANEIRQFIKYFEWFPACSVRENPDTIEANGNGEKPPAADDIKFDEKQAEMDDDEDFKQFMQEIKNELLKDSGPRHSFDGSVSGRRRSVDGASARRRSIGVASNGRLSVDGAASAMRSSSGNRLMRSKSVSLAPTRSLTTSKLSEETIQQLVERYSPPNDS